MIKLKGKIYYVTSEQGEEADVRPIELPALGKGHFYEIQGCEYIRFTGGMCDARNKAQIGFLYHSCGYIQHFGGLSKNCRTLGKGKEGHGFQMIQCTFSRIVACVSIVEGHEKLPEGKRMEDHFSDVEKGHGNSFEFCTAIGFTNVSGTGYCIDYETRKNATLYCKAFGMNQRSVTASGIGGHEIRGGHFTGVCGIGVANYTKGITRNVTIEANTYDVTGPEVWVDPQTTENVVRINENPRPAPSNS